MLSSLFHAWERRLVSLTTNRTTRPFDWGLDWVPQPDGTGDRLAGGPPQGSSEARVRAWVEHIMADTDAFFDAPPTPDYEFRPADAARQRRGEAGTLRYPSALTTPHDANNVAVGRWFPAPGEPPVGARGPRGRAVLVLPQWNSDADGHVGLARLLARFGVSALRMSLPYHDVRMPPELTRADYIVSSNVVRTIQVCRQAVLDARRAVAWLAGQGYERIGILGTSLGSCLAMLTTAHEPRIRAQALNHVSPRFADVVWRGISTRHVRDGLNDSVNLDLLRDLWRPISPASYFTRVRHARALLVYARYDLTFPIDLSEELVREFRSHGIPHETVVLPCGHYTTGVPPFKFLDGFVLTRFLRNSL